jgi:DNA-damage-inducible protein D
VSDGIDILVHPGGSPFDAIRHTDATGREYWLGRELMPHLGYEKWERFYDAVIRAQAACGNSGHAVARNFRQVTELPGAGKLGGNGQVARVPRVNFELSRFGAYLVSMNGDPRKPEVAAAQTYFATATRWAETAQRVGFELPKTFAEALELAAKQTRALEAAEEEVRVKALEAAQATADADRWAKEARERGVQAERLDSQLAATLGELGAAQPKVEAYEAFLGQAGAYPLAVAAQMLGTGRQRLIDMLGAWRVLIIRPGHSDHLRPYTDHLHEGRFVVKSQDVPITHRDGTNEVITRGTTLVTPKGLDYIRARRIREEQRRTLQADWLTPVPSVA